jgi:putative DNA primase/helicase
VAEGKKATLGYEMTKDGLFYHYKKKPDDAEVVSVWLSPPFGVKARTRDKDDLWGKLLVWKDHDGHEVQWVMDGRLLGGDQRILWQSLYERGLEITAKTDDRNLLFRFLVEQKPQKRARVVSRLGWHDVGQMVFVLPDRAYGGVGDMEIIYRNKVHNPYEVRGSLEDWRNQIGRLCTGNSRLVLAVSIGLASSLLMIVGEESGGVHFQGDSRSGKSTAGILAASVGGKPSDIVQLWRATSNGLEAICEERCDGLLVLDEIGQVDPKEAGEIAYMIANNKGKQRAGRDAEGRKSKEWRLLFLSTGELSLADKMAEAGRKTRAGQEVRLLDVPADAGAGMGIFENLHGADSAGAFAEQLRRVALDAYGAPLRGFVDQIARALADDPVAIRSACREMRDNFIRDNLPAGASGQVRTACGRFGLIAAAGEIATAFGLTGWPEGEATRAGLTCFRAWLERGTTGDHDIEKGIQQVISYIERYGSARFEELGAEYPPMIHNRVGFRRLTEDRAWWQYLVLPEAWKDELCRGYNSKAIASEMIKRGQLVAHQGRTTAVIRCGKEGRLRVYQLAIGGEPDNRTPAERRLEWIADQMGENTGACVAQPFSATGATGAQPLLN